jgi:transposase-like protein
MRRIAKTAAPPDLWQWAYARVPKIAAAFRGVDQEELQAELAVTLLRLLRSPPKGIRNWKSYFAKSLLNRAAALAKRWRRRQATEASVDFEPIDSAPSHVERFAQDSLQDDPLPDPASLTSRLSRRSLRFLEELSRSEFSISRLARRLGVHSNTVGRRLCAIREFLRSTQNVSKSFADDLATSLVDASTSERTASRLSMRARIIHALIEGSPYRSIRRQLKVSQPTISRWRKRFENFGPAGLRSKHRIPARSEGRLRFEAWLRQASAGEMNLPQSVLAKRFGIGKTTIHRCLLAFRR